MRSEATRGLGQGRRVGSVREMHTHYVLGTTVAPSPSQPTPLNSPRWSAPTHCCWAARPSQRKQPDAGPPGHPFLIIAILVGTKWYLIVILISLVSNGVEHIFMFI